MTLQRCFNNCCVEDKPASALCNLPWGEEEGGVFTFICMIHTNPCLGYGFTLELPAGYCGRAGSDPLLNNVTCVFQMQMLKLAWRIQLWL